ncbi:MAG TPA: hypothetical protein VF041_16525 [Gemmatimonadaceae bacterium]
MTGTKKIYETPAVRAVGEVVDATREGQLGITESHSPFFPRDPAGQIGFGL